MKRSISGRAHGNAPPDMLLFLWKFISTEHNNMGRYLHNARLSSGNHALLQAVMNGAPAFPRYEVPAFPVRLHNLRFQNPLYHDRKEIQIRNAVVLLHLRS